MDKPKPKKGKSRFISWGEILDPNKLDKESAEVLDSFKIKNAPTFDTYTHKDLLPDHILNRLEQEEIWKLNDLRDAIKLAKENKDKDLVNAFKEQLDLHIRKYIAKHKILW